MKYSVILISLLLLAVTSAAYPQQIQKINYQGREVVRDELIIKFKKSTGITAQSAGRNSRLNVIRSKNASVQKVFTNGAEHWKVSTGNMEALIQELNSNPEVEYAEPNYIIHISTVPNDPLLKNQLAINGTTMGDISAIDAWDITHGDTSIVVGILDTGIDYLHEDLRANIWTNKNEIPGNGIDDDNNGYIDDIHGWDFVNKDNDPMDDNHHGTHVAGILGAIGNNNVGVAGVAWDVKLAALKFIKSNGEGTTSAAVEAVEYCIANGIKITNNSWGGPAYSMALYDAIAKANTAGMIFVAAAGNDGTDNDVIPQYPASFDLPNIISVAATDMNDNLAAFSNYGKTSVDLAAPGVNIFSCTPNGNYQTLSGTSMATPFVTGAVVLIKSVFPEKNNLEIISKLLSSVDAKVSLSGKTVTGGRLNLFKPLINSSISLVKLSAKEVNIGGVIINSGNMPQKKFTITNGSTENVIIDTVKAESGFLISNSSGAFSDVLLNIPLGAMQSLDIAVKADPREEKSYDGLISVRFSRASLSWYKEVRCRYSAFSKGTVILPEEVSGIWSQSMSPIVINSSVKVAAGQKLEIGPGVEVIFFNNSGISSSSDALTGSFNIRAAGTRQDSIYFRSADSKTPWGGFSMSGRGKYIFEYCNFLNASKNSTNEGSGGAVKCNGPDLRIVNSRFFGNHAIGEGGAVQYLGNEGTVYIDSSDFTGNDAGLGGALDLRGKENWLLNSKFYFNKCSQGVVKIQGTTTGTYSTEKAFVYNCSFINNLSSYGGNMIDASSMKKIVIKNCLGTRNYISINQAVINLSLISTAIVSNCTLYDNSSGQDGSGLMVSNVTECVLENSILWNNLNTEIKTSQAIYQKFTASYNSIKNYSAGTGNINVAPDIADTLFYHLAANSPLRDKGSPFAIYNDQDGTRNDLGYEGGNQLMICPANIDFGINGLTNSTKKTVPVECVSFYKDAVPVKSWSLSSDAFSVSGMPGEILPLKTTEILISYYPKQVKSYFDTLYINTDFIPVNKIKIPLSGICGDINSIGGEISGELKNTGTGIYHVVNDLHVSKESVLTIDPGVTLLFQPNTKLTVEGDLAIKGTAEQKVTFSAESDNSYAGVITIKQNNTKDILLENLVMRKTLGFNIQSITHKIVFNNCEFKDNKNISEVNSPFINSYGSVAQFNNCRFHGNNTEGPVVYSASGKLFVNNCLFTGNSAAGAYILSDNSVINIYNSSLFNNKSYAGIVLRTNPALGAFRDSCMIVNSILADNVNADAKYPYEISVMSQNMSAPAENPDVKLYLELTNSCIKGGRPRLFVPANSRVFLILSMEVDPGFADAYGNLGPSSACINAGTNSYKNLPFSLTDLAGNFRIWNKRIDIGAYEYGSKKYLPIPEKPVLDYPKDQTAIAKDVTFKWKQVPGALTYNIQVSSTNTFETRASDSTLTDTVKVMSLSFGSKYYWRVQAMNTTAAGQWSDVWSFSTFIAAPASNPVLSKPLNNAVNQPLSLTLCWRKLKTSEKYHLQVSTKYDFSSLLVNDTTLIDTLKQLPGLSINSVYFWRVRGINQGGKSLWSEEWTFTTIPPVPQTPLLAKPANDSKENVLAAKLSWNAMRYTDRYRLIVAEDDKFTKIKSADSTVKDTVREVKELKEGMKYFWKVSSLNAAGESPGSEIWNFTTLLNAPDSLDTNVISWDKLELSWKDRSNGESGFIIERKQSEDFIALDTVEANQTTYTDSTVRVKLSYQYRIRSYTTYVLSAYSNVASATITAVDELSLIPKEYSLFQNYPNPFNPATVIKYGLPAESRVKLIIYNSLGEAVGEYLNEIQSAGFHQINFDAGRISSGVYYYLLEARATDGSKEYRKVKKMIVIK
ncbi:MAG: S8 family serine peptidase [Syntrophomonadaceae bacterium]